MCSEPIKLRTGTMVQCRKCQDCRNARRRSMIGKLMGEAETSDSSMFLNLTYGGGDHEKAAVLDVKDVQRFFKRWRRAGYRFRYVFVGEYGGQLGRAHWHLLLFFRGPAPQIKYGVITHIDEWPHGHVFAEEPRSKQASCAYIMKYLDKPGFDVRLRYSKRPALGTDYLIGYAEKHAMHGLPLFADGDRYTIPGNVASNGKLFWYHIGRDRKIYADMVKAWCIMWYRCRPNQKPILTEDVEDVLTELAEDYENFDPEFKEVMDAWYPSTDLDEARRTVWIATDKEGFLVKKLDFEYTLVKVDEGGYIEWQERVRERDVPAIKEGRFETGPRIIRVDLCDEEKRMIRSVDGSRGSVVLFPPLKPDFSSPRTPPD